MPTFALVGMVLAFAMPQLGAVSQFSVKVSISVSGSTEFAGQIEANGTSGGSYYEAAAHETLRLVVHANEGRLRILSSPYVTAGVPRPPGGAGQTLSRPVRTEVLSEELFTGTIELMHPSENASYRFLPLVATEEMSLRFSGNQAFKIAPPIERGSARKSDHIPEHDPNINRPLWPAADTATLQGPQVRNLSVNHGAFVFLFGGEFVLRGTEGEPRHVWTGRTLNESLSIHPEGRAGIWYYDQILMLVSGRNVSAEISGADPNRLYTSIRGIEGVLDGDLSFAGVSGEVAVNGQLLQPEPALFQTIGQFSGSAEYGGGKGTWAFEGPATFVGINGLTVVGDRLAHLQQTVWTVVGGVTLLGLLVAALTPAGRAFLGGILGRNEAEPLGHPTRKLLLKSIAQTPGITRSQLAQETQITRLLARYHLRILRRAGLIDTVRTGRQVAFALNDASYRFPLDRVGGQPKEPQANGAPKPAVLAVHALAALNGPVRRLIHQALEHAGPCSYDDMTRAWRDLEAPQPWPSRSQVSRHATALLRAGLLERRRTWKRVQWALAVDLAGVRSTAMMRVLSNAKTRLVHELATQHPKLSRDQIVERFAQRFPTRAASTVDEILLKLEYAGLLPGAGPANTTASSRPVPNPAAASPG